ncbi:MAG: ATP-dependent helicase, partial [Candidatus Woesearchaeota archaeon]|nr:ATP-dependent helicase [Candidatus Woesearchaeota archaeon]
IGKRGRMSRVIHMTNIGTIPDEASVIVKLGERKIGTIEEPFLEKLKKGDLFVLGGEVYQFLFSRGMVAQVSASSSRPPTVPSWFSETLPLSFDLAMEIGRLRRLIEEKMISGNTREQITEFINSYLYVDNNSAYAIYEYFKEQYDYVKEIPSDKKILVEHYIDEEGRRYAVFHALFGRRVNDCLSRAIAFAISRTQHRDTDIGINDNGFYIGYVSKINAVSAFNILKP